MNLDPVYSGAHFVYSEATKKAFLLAKGAESMIGVEIREKRVSEGITGAILCLKAGIGRTRLSDIERGYVEATPAELQCLTEALAELITARQKIRRAAADVGWPSQEAPV